MTTYGKYYEWTTVPGTVGINWTTLMVLAGLKDAGGHLPLGSEEWELFYYG
jgi:hypothetical protein